MGKSTINGPFSIAMLVITRGYPIGYHRVPHIFWSPHLWRPRLCEGVHHGVVLRGRAVRAGAVLQGCHAGAGLRATPGTENDKLL